MTHQLDRSQARRIAIRAQLLAYPRPTNLLSVVKQLTFVQVDPTAAIAPNADLVLWSRLGSSYEPGQLTRALEKDRTLFEFNAMVRPMTDLPLYRASMAAWPTRDSTRAWLRANKRFRQDVLDRLAASGPLLSRDIPDTAAVPWGSSGWTNDRNVTQMLECLMMQGAVAISRRRGRQRVWDLAERVYPGSPAIPEPEALRRRNQRRLRSLGIAREKVPAMPMEPAYVGDAGEPAVVDGVPGSWRVDPEALGQPFEGRTALLSPFDRLIHHRPRTLELFGFEYVLEMYKPASQRRWGYFALPILHGDQLVGKLDATADRKGGALVVHAIHEDVPFSPAMRRAVDREINDLATWLQLERPAAKG